MARRPPPQRSEKPCECGCGEFTNLVRETSHKHGYIKGEPHRYLKGHSSQDKRPWYERAAERYEVDPETGCWNWTGSLSTHGYGQIGVKDVTTLVHRLMYEHHRGPIPEGLDLDHLCRNRGCVNPDHLEAVTRAVNLRRGAQTKLTQEQVDFLRAMREQMGLSYRRLAARFGISRSHARQICIGAKWAR